MEASASRSDREPIAKAGGLFKLDTTPSDQIHLPSGELMEQNPKVPFF